MVKDLSALPRKGAGGKGSCPPDRPRFSQLIVDKWKVGEFAREQRPTVVDGQVWRPSKSGSCSAEMWFDANGYVPERPETTAFWSFAMGNFVHSWLDKLFLECWPYAKIEHQYKTTYRGMTFGGNVDAVLDVGDWRTAFEFKSINGMGYQQSVLGKEGPRDSAVLQAAVNGFGCNADEVVVIYVGLQVVSAAQAKRKNVAFPEYQRFISEWTYSKEEFTELAVTELDRVLDSVMVASPVRRPLGVPVMAEVTNPLTGQWTELNDAGKVVRAGNVWNCGYCGQQAACDEHLKKVV